MRKFIIGLLLAVSVVFAQQQLPQRDTITVADLKTKIAECVLQSDIESKYESKLIARIQQLEKELAELKSNSSSTTSGGSK